MPLLGRIFAGDEELGKKDDDHKPKKGHVLPSPWVTRHSMPVFRRRRLVYGVVLLFLLYLLIQNVPLYRGLNLQRRGSRAPGENQVELYEAAPTGKPPRPRIPSKLEEHYYQGRIKFYNLAVSLHAAMSFGGYNRVKKDVLFAASDLKSASEIIPLACEMASWRKNVVHFSLMGRDELDISDIQELNGISDESCTINWHDARPDYSRWSSDFRMEVSVAAALGHIQSFIDPQVIITDHASRENGFFIKAMRAKSSEIGKSLIELPPDATENLMWLARLDSGSLAAWQTVYVDLVIHAPPRSSGSLIRLIKSIEAADYFGSRRPHLTIELPAEIDPPTLDFLENLVWPPIDGSGGPHASQVTLRHRLPRYGFTAEEASIHFIESFYPARPKDSHVLLISPQVELSPIYYHYVMYNLLQYKYATYIQLTHASKNLMGFSLELPSTYLNNSAELKPPALESPKKGLGLEPEGGTSFLWQAPNSNAALYFGDKWVELHSFLSARISIQNPSLFGGYKPPSRLKVVSEYYPSWMEYVQELMRTRGYSLLYPFFPARSDAVVIVHDELYQLPEEYLPTRRQSSINPTPTPDLHDPFITDPSAHTPSLATHQESSLLTSKLLSILPHFGDFYDLLSLPILSYDGNLMLPSISESNAIQFADDFRREIGRCSAKDTITYSHMSALDLFCNPDQHEGSLIDSEEESTTNKEGRIPTREVVGSPFQFPSQLARGTAQTSANGGEDVQNEFASHLSRQSLKRPADTDKQNQLGKDDTDTEGSALNLNSGDDKVVGYSSAEATLKQDQAGDLGLREPQVALEPNTETSTERTSTQGSPSLSATEDLGPSNSKPEFIPPTVRHPGW